MATRIRGTSPSRPSFPTLIAARKGRRRTPHPFTPDPLVLEARALLSTLTVTNDNDSGVGSLGAKLAAADAGDTINLPSAHGEPLT